MVQRNGTGRIRAYLWHCAPLNWVIPSDLKEAKRVLLEIFYDWAHWYRKFIEQGDESAIYLPVGHRWSHKSGVTLIGDAAHLTSHSRVRARTSR